MCVCVMSVVTVAWEDEFGVVPEAGSGQEEKSQLEFYSSLKEYGLKIPCLKDLYSY